MAAPKKNDLAKLFKQAAEIAGQVPESMQDAAFNRALDMLSGAQTQGTAANTPKAAQPGGTFSPTPPPGASATNKLQSVDQLLDAIDSTQHPEVRTAATVRDRAMHVLRIALDEHHYDGMSTGEIAKVLTEKFRLSTTSNAVNMAISGETSLVDRVRKGRGFVYRIMDPGRNYLAQLGKGSGPSASTSGGRSKRKKRKAVARSKSKKKSKNKSKKKARKKTAKKANKKSASSRSAPGPKAAVLSLLDAGYFKRARTGAEVQEYLDTKKGFQYGVDQLALAMLRLVREEKLDRDQNESGAYEYSEA